MSEVLFEEISGNGGDLGVITLNRPSALNALNHKMILDIDYHLSIWEKANSIKAVIVQAVPGRAFCAGGDVRAIYDKKMQQDENLIQFFVDEYRLNQRIQAYSKPYISYLNGITMGGGAGISIHGSHRVGTENLIFAMPETAIGFFPDVGSSYFLSRMPHHFGLYLGLTGERIGFEDCLELKLVTQIIKPEEWENVKKVLAENEGTGNKALVTFHLNQFAQPATDAPIFREEKEIEKHFGKNSVEEILESLHHSDQEWCKKTLKTLETKSPTSLKVTFKELNEAKNLDFKACMKMEIQIMRQFLHSHDFFEGIRAMLVDKDRNPQWQPCRVEAVLDQNTLPFFA